VKREVSLEPRVDFFTLSEILQMAAAHKGLVLRPDARKAYTEPVKEYKLTREVLTFLSERGITRQPRPDSIFTLVDTNPQGPKTPGWSHSNYWNFQRSKDGEGAFDVRVDLCVGLVESTSERGVILSPLAHGSFLSPTDRLPNFRMFKALVDQDPEAPEIAKELAASDGSIVVTWADLGLGGLRRLADIFWEFARDNEPVQSLAREQKVFDPVPLPRYQQPGGEMYVAEPAQPRIFAVWRAQLEEYRSHLRV